MRLNDVLWRFWEIWTCPRGKECNVITLVNWNRTVLELNSDLWLYLATICWNSPKTFSYSLQLGFKSSIGFVHYQFRFEINELINKTCISAFLIDFSDYFPIRIIFYFSFTTSYIQLFIVMFNNVELNSCCLLRNRSHKVYRCSFWRLFTGKKNNRKIQNADTGGFFHKNYRNLHINKYVCFFFILNSNTFKSANYL